MSIHTLEPVGSLRAVPEVRLGLGGGGLLITTAACVALGVPTTVTGIALLVQTGLCSLALAHRAAAVLLGVTGWAMCTGFAVNQLGQLTFARGDLLRLAVYLACALAFRRGGGATQ